MNFLYKMKREIKFREWDNENGVFILPENLVYRLDGHLFDRELDIELHNVELMQFTGLLDKNGKEIYEGDILKNEFGEKVVDLSKIEVIGNLYENPELLV